MNSVGVPDTSIHPRILTMGSQGGEVVWRGHDGRDRETVVTTVIEVGTMWVRHSR